MPYNNNITHMHYSTFTKLVAIKLHKATYLELDSREVNAVAAVAGFTESSREWRMRSATGWYNIRWSSNESFSK